MATNMEKATQEAPAEAFRTLYVDPGEDTGWCIGRGFRLLAAGTEKLWPFADEVWAALNDPSNPDASILNDPSFNRNEVADDENLGPIGRIVCEDFRLYPWAIFQNGRPTHAHDFDQFRTARLIGALTWFARDKQIPFVLQPASIKKTAVAAGAEEFYYRPLKENRHQNDAIQHFVFFTNTELRGIKIEVPNG